MFLIYRGFVYLLALTILSALILLPTMASGQISDNFEKQERPLYELGLGIIGLNVPSYPGAKHRETRAIPFPRIVYRGRYFRSDDEGTRARVQGDKSSELGISVGYNFPIDTGDNDARTGMPDLDALFEIGPRILFRFFTEDPLQRLSLSFGLRSAFSTDLYSNFDGHGFVFEPSLFYRRKFYQGAKTSFFTGLSLEAGDKKYNRFFYQVDPIFSTPTRAPYFAKAGLTQARLLLGTAHQFNNKIQIFVAGSYSDLNLAANKKSPLIEKDQNISFIAGFFWLFYESEQTVSM